MTAVLVVCTGNVCRSPMAEGFLRAALERRFGHAAPAVSSAGTAGWEGSGAMDEAIDAAAERGVDISDHVARRLVSGMAADADLVLCMAAEHRDAIDANEPEAGPKTFTLKELTGLLEASADGRADEPDVLPARVAAADVARRGGAGQPRDMDIADPLGSPLDIYRAVAWELDTWSERFVEAAYGPVGLPAGKRV
jgi:low molecular weight protein-tyrosine phosphatase